MKADKFEIVIRNEGTGGTVKWVVTVTPHSTQAMGEIERLLPDIISGPSGTMLTITAEPKKVVGVEIGFGTVDVSHQYTGTEVNVKDGRMGDLYAIARKSFRALGKTANAVETAKKWTNFKNAATRIATTFLNFPALLDKMEIELVPAKPCGNHFHPMEDGHDSGQHCGHEGQGMGMIRMAFGSSMGGSPEEMVEDLRQQLMQQVTQGLEIATPFTVFDPDGIIGNSPFRAAALAELKEEATTAVKNVLGKILASAERKFLRELTSFMGTRSQLTERGVVLPEMDARLAKALETAPLVELIEPTGNGHDVVVPPADATAQPQPTAAG